MPFRVIPFRDRLLNRLVKGAPLCELERGDRAFRRGEEATEVVLVREGHLIVRTPLPDGGGRAADLVLPWEIGGEDALVRGGGVHLEGAFAGEASVVQRLDGRAVRRVLRRAEGTFDAFWTAARGRLQLARALGPGARTGSARDRLGRLLLHLAERSTGRDEGETGPLRVPIRITHRVLGEMAGLHRSTVTTILNDWLYEGRLRAEEVGWSIPAPEGLLDG